MAEFMFKKMVSQAGRKDEFLIESAAVSTEEIGHDMYPPACKKLSEKKFRFLRAVQDKLLPMIMKTLICLSVWM